MKRTVFYILFCLISIGSYAQTKDTIKVLFIGNSYTHARSLPQVVSMLSDSTDTKIIARKSTKGGAKLVQHWHGFRGLKSKEMIASGEYDIVVIQQYSLGATHFPDSTLYYGKLLCDYAKEHGAKPYLYLTWARKKVPQYQEVINKIYYQLAKETGATVVPVGKGWQLAMDIRPTVELYTSDGSHQNYLGNYISAAIFVGMLTGQIPEKMPQGYSLLDIDGESIELFHLDWLDIEFCLKIAKQIVEEEKK